MQEIQYLAYLQNVSYTSINLSALGVLDQSYEIVLYNYFWKTVKNLVNFKNLVISIGKAVLFQMFLVCGCCTIWTPMHSNLINIYNRRLENLNR